MKRKGLLKLAILVLLGMGVLFSIIAFDLPGLQNAPEVLELTVITRESDSSVWSAARQGMEQAAGDYGVELRFLTLGSNNSVEEQRTLIEREAEVGTDGIILSPADPAALEETVGLAAEQTIVVTMESDMTQSGATACVCVDNQALGEALGLAAHNAVRDGGEAVLLNSAPGSTGVALRLQAAKEALEQNGCQAYICTPGEREVAEALSELIQVRRPDAVVAFEPMALEQVARVVQNFQNPPLVYGMGATNTIAAYLEQGGITAIAAQNDYALGYLAVEIAAKAARKEPFHHLEPIGFSIVRKENMYDPDQQKLLFPVTR